MVYSCDNYHQTFFSPVMFFLSTTNWWNEQFKFLCFQGIEILECFSHVQLVESIIKFCCLIQMGSVHLCLMCNRKSRLCFVLLYSIISTM